MTIPYLWPTPLANRRRVRVTIKLAPTGSLGVAGPMSRAAAARMRRKFGTRTRPRARARAACGRALSHTGAAIWGVGHDARVRIPCRRHRAALFCTAARAIIIKWHAPFRRARLRSTRFVLRVWLCAQAQLLSRDYFESSANMSRWHAAVNQDVEDTDPASDATSAFHGARDAHTPRCSAASRRARSTAGPPMHIGCGISRTAESCAYGPVSVSVTRGRTV